MGICISSVSSEIRGAEEAPQNEVVFELGSNIYYSNRNLGSVCSKEGCKGINQDAAVLYQSYGTEDGTFVGLFDGHGTNGDLVSKIVSCRLPLLILNQKHAPSKLNGVVDDDNSRVMLHQHGKDDEDDLIENKDGVYEWKEAIIAGFKVMDKELKLQEKVDCFCSGTTAVIVLRQGEHLVIANLGDSRAVLGTVSEGEVTAVQLTTDLKPCVPSEADRIRKSNGRVFALEQEPHIQRVWKPYDNSPGLAMSRAFGDFQLKDNGIIAVPDISYHRITPTDQFLVLATDGVWDVLSNNKVTSIVWRAQSEEEAARAVVDAATDTWRSKFPSAKMDDRTATCIFLRQK